MKQAAARHSSGSQPHSSLSDTSVAVCLPVRCPRTAFPCPSIPSLRRLLLCLSLCLSNLLASILSLALTRHIPSSPSVTLSSRCFCRPSSSVVSAPVLQMQRAARTVCQLLSLCATCSMLCQVHDGRLRPSVVDWLLCIAVATTCLCVCCGMICALCVAMYCIVSGVAILPVIQRHTQHNTLLLSTRFAVDAENR